MKPTIGILLDDQTYGRIPSRKTGYERVVLYDKAARRLNLNPFYMTLRQTGKTAAVGFTPTGARYRLVRRPIPKVIHNRIITFAPRLKKKLAGLAKRSIVYNRQNRYDKFKIHRVLQQIRDVQPYLPRTVRFSRERLSLAMKEQASLYIKPTNSSVGNGIIKLSKQKNGLWDIQWRKGKPARMTTRKAVQVVARMVGNRRYLIQETVQLATYHRRPYDLRVSVQRDGSGQWQITGVVGKVAAAGRHVTNVAKGGKVKRCEALFRSSGFDAPGMLHSVKKASLTIVRSLSERLPHLADLGLDIGVDRKGRIKLIEINGKDQRISFQKAGLRQTFARTYENPLAYGKWLLQRRASTLQVKRRK